MSNLSNCYVLYMVDKKNQPIFSCTFLDLEEMYSFLKGFLIRESDIDRVKIKRQGNIGCKFDTIYSCFSGVLKIVNVR